MFVSSLAVILAAAPTAQSADAFARAQQWEELYLAFAAVSPLLQLPEWPWDWPETLRSKGPEARAACAALLLTEASWEQLEHNLFTVTEPRVALKEGKGFAAYERPGELSGSAVLGHPAALATYAEALVAQARAASASCSGRPGSDSAPTELATMAA